MVRHDFVRRKLHLIAEDLGNLTQFKNKSFEELTEDFIALATVERLVERVVTRAIDINEHLIGELATGKEERIARLTYRDTFIRLSDVGVYPKKFALSIAKSASLRNILVHDYNDADRRILYSSIGQCLREYRRYIQYTLKFLGKLRRR